MYHAVSDIHMYCTAVHMYEPLSYTFVFCDHIPYNQEYWRKEYLAVCRILGDWWFLFWWMASPGDNKVSCQNSVSFS